LNTFAGYFEKLTHSLIKALQNQRTVYVARCPRFSWDRVNFHQELVGLTQTSQS